MLTLRKHLRQWLIMAAVLSTFSSEKAAADPTDTWVFELSDGTPCTAEFVWNYAAGTAQIYALCGDVDYSLEATNLTVDPIVFAGSFYSTSLSGGVAGVGVSLSADERSATISGYVQASGTAVRLCDNDVADVGEDCADQNFDNGDCCSSHCHLEPGCQCSDLPQFADSDGDGVPNYADECGSTIASYGVDDRGCSLEQFCLQQDVSTQAGRNECRKRDWLNDEPRMKRNEKDCTYSPQLGLCIPALEAPCDDGYADCDGNPVNGCEVHVDADLDNCGFCGVACASGPHSTAICEAGTCTLPCDPGFADCDGSAVTGCEKDLENDEANCGACAATCAVGIPCSHGACGCTAGEMDCNSDVGNGCEIDTSNDVSNCGACSATCAAGEECFAAACEPVCRGFADCRRVFLSSQRVNGNLGGLAGADALCQALAQSANLGGTYKAWLSDSTTDAGARLEHAVVPYIRLDGAKVADNWNDLTDGAILTPINVTDRAESLTAPTLGAGTNTKLNGTRSVDDPQLTCQDWTSSLATLGAFGGAVNSWGTHPEYWTQYHVSPFSCAGLARGYCIEQCAAPHVDCDGSASNGCEVNTQTDVNHCGACANPCPPPNANQTATCMNGSCDVQCSTGYTDCNGNPADGCEVHTAEHLSNCGACGNVCAAGEQCQAGVCTVSCGPFADCRRVFLTSARVGNALGGLAGTDALCQTFADNAGVRGIFRAWLSSSTVSAASRLEHASVPYVRLDGVAVALDWTDLTDGGLAAPINVSEQGLAITGPGVVGVGTGTTDTGQIASSLPAENCNDWTSSSSSVSGRGGIATMAGAGWSFVALSVLCSDTAHRYCIDQCSPSRLDCDGASGNGCEVDPTTDVEHCGACGHLCPSGSGQIPTCSNGTCGVQCAAGRVDCNGNPIDGCEVNTFGGANNCGGCGTACAPVEQCIQGQCLPPGKYVFATSTTHTGILGGLSGADTICNQRATAAGLPGSYAAWLSTDTVSAADRLTHATVPYVRPDGVIVADDWTDLTDESLDNPISVDELSQTVSGSVWTSTEPSGVGVASPFHCLEWTSESSIAWVGATNATSTEWTVSSTYRPCYDALRLYCLQQ